MTIAIMNNFTDKNDFIVFFSAFDLDVVKLTAQFVARNGRQFLTNLMNREQRNYQASFMTRKTKIGDKIYKLIRF
jgi:splicing factor 3A subunit 1